MQSSKFLHLGTDTHKSVVTTTKIKREQNRVKLHTHTTHSEKNTVIHMLTTTSTLSSSLATSSSSSRLLSRTDAKKRHHQRQRQHSSPSAFASSLSKTNFATTTTTTRTTKAGVFNAATTRTAQNEKINSINAALQRTKKKKSVVVTFASAAADGAAAPPVGTFTIGIAWFFMHQIIGVANDVIMKAAGQTLSVAQVVFLRFFFATLTMLPVMLISGKDSFKTDRLPLHFARSALLAMGIFLYAKGLTVAPIAVVTTLNFTIPLFTLVLARFVLKEKVDVNRWIGTVVGFLGVCVVLKPTGGAAGLGSFNMSWLLILAAATMFSSLDVLNKVFVGRESFWAMIFYTALFTTLIFSPFAFMGWVAPTMTQYGALAALGAGANALLYCLLKSFSMVDASALAPFRYTELILSAGVGWVLFKEAISMNTILGAMVIVPSTLYVVWKENQKKEE